MTASEDPLDGLAPRFRRFAESEARGYSPLYERLGQGVAEDRELLALASRAGAGQPPPNLLFGSVHYLLLSGVAHDLARFYPSLGGSLSEKDDPVPAFRNFALTYHKDIEALLSKRIVQTNEVGRSACLMPAFAHVAGLTHGPLALIEIGASAGLNLLVDRFYYDYGDLGVAGDPDSPVRLVCRVDGGGRPPVEAAPAIGYRIGVDLNPIDPFDTRATAWLRALVWPEHQERADALEAALEVARRGPPKVLAGDGVDLLPSLIEAVPTDLPVCVFHSFVLHQWPRQARERLYDVIAAHSWRRPIFDISYEGTPEGVRTAKIELARCLRGDWRRTVLARCQAHGQSLEWLV